MQVNAPTNLYPYDLPEAGTLFDSTHTSKLFHSKPAQVDADGRAIYAVLRDTVAGITLESMQDVCEIVQKVKATAPLHISRHSKAEDLLQLKHKLSHSVFVVPGKKGTKVFLSEHRRRKYAPSAQGFRFKKCIKLKFDSQGRLSKSKHAIEEIVALETHFNKNDPELFRKEHRISIMQKLKKSPYFPKNFAFVRYASRSGTKVRIFQEKAHCDLLYLHNSILPLDKLAEKNKILICKELVLALLDMAKQGLIHRDFKLDNILVFPELQPNGTHTIHVKLTDVGYSCSTSDLAALKELVGSLAWCAPEIMQRRKKTPEETNTTRAIDIFALGLLMHVLTNGRVSAYQDCLFKMQNLTSYIHYCDQIKAFGEIKHPSVEQYHALLVPLQELRLYAKGEALPEIDDEFLDMIAVARRQYKNELAALELEWPKLAASLPVSPRTAKALEDVACAFLQNLPEARMSLEEAIVVLTTLDTSICTPNAP